MAWISSQLYREQATTGIASTRGKEESVRLDSRPDSPRTRGRRAIAGAASAIAQGAFGPRSIPGPSASPARR